MQDVCQPGMRLGFYNRGSTKEIVDVGVLMSNPLKCKVVLLSVSAAHAAFHFQTCTKSLTRNLAKKTLASLYRYTMWHNTEGKVSPPTVNHPLETTSVEWQYEQASLCADSPEGCQTHQGSPWAELPALPSWEETGLLRRQGAV